MFSVWVFTLISMSHLGCKRFGGHCGHMLGLSGSPEETVVVSFSSSPPSILMYCYILNCFGTSPSWNTVLCAGSWRSLWRGCRRNGFSEHGREAKQCTEPAFCRPAIAFSLRVLISLIYPLVTNNLPILFYSFTQFILHTAARATFVKCKNAMPSMFPAAP